MEHFTRAMISGILAGALAGIIECLLATPVKLLVFTDPRVLGYIFVPSLINISPFLIFNGIIFVLTQATAVIWRDERIGNGPFYYLSFDLLFLSLFLAALYDLNRSNHIVSYIDQMNLMYYLFLSLIFLSVFLFTGYLLIRSLGHKRFARYSLGVVLPLASVAFLIFLLTYQTRDQVNATGRTIPDQLSFDRPENVILITLDTQRADYLGCYGHETAASPNIDRLAGEGVRFRYCIANNPLTLPSHASLLTSTYPIHHGVRKNTGHKVSDDVHTLAEVLKENGYETAAFLSSRVLGMQFGLNQGFDRYRIDECLDFLLFDRVLKETVFSKIILPRLPFSQQMLDWWVESVTNNAILWIREPREKPFFLWLHYFNPHKPYAPPYPYAIPYLRQMDDGRKGYFTAPTYRGVDRFSRSELERDKAMYLGEVTYTDYNVGLFLDALEWLELMENTLIVLTADHGEAFGENDDVMHGQSLFDTNIHVPLIFSDRDRVPEGEVIDGICESVDIMPTILEYLDISGPAEMQGLSLLSNLLEGRRLRGRSAYTETIEPHQEEDWLHSVVVDGWKYVYAPWGDEEILFNLREDFDESRNLIYERLEKAERMQEDLVIFYEENTSEENWVPVDAGEKHLERLRSLGYVK